MSILSLFLSPFLPPHVYRFEQSDKYCSKHTGTGEQLKAQARPITVLFQHLSRGNRCVTANITTGFYTEYLFICLFIYLFIVYLMKLSSVLNTRRRQL